MRIRNGLGLAFVAACLFVLQSFVGAFAASAMQASPQSDAFGNPLCLTVDHANTGDSDGGHAILADCCLLGCGPSAQLLAATPNPDGYVPILVYSGSLKLPLARDPVPARQHLPGYPRAPPALIA
ncbi:hypothetical protein [Ensifer adhaerens]|uniref:hypothetical protein n=1 Tax=Ensifer adhaerens TaxID=106592 RepID=UPI0015C3E087|nr:hypothetical protein [Ensifer adhaerens]